MKFGAGDGAQTRDLRLGKATLYQLSYSREQKDQQATLRPGLCQLPWPEISSIFPKIRRNKGGE